MALVIFLKDCKWCIDNKVENFLEKEEKEIKDDVAKEMVKANYAEYVNEPKKEIDNKMVGEEKIDNKIVKEKQKKIKRKHDTN